VWQVQMFPKNMLPARSALKMEAERLSERWHLPNKLRGIRTQRTVFVTLSARSTSTLNKFHSIMKEKDSAPSYYH
jgi:hypothetical protein